MSKIRFRTTAKGNLPHLSYIFRKPEPLGTKFKTVAWSVTGALLFIDWHPFPSHQVSGISITRGNQFRRFWPQGFDPDADKNTDEWWRDKILLDGFNTVCKNIAASFFEGGGWVDEQNSVSDSGFRNIYDKCGKLPFAVVRNRILLIDSSPTF